MGKTLLSFVLMLALAACSDDTDSKPDAKAQTDKGTTGEQGVTKDAAPDKAAPIPDVATGDTSAPSFASKVEPIFTKNCASAKCHAGASPSAKLNLEQGKVYASMVKVKSGDCPTQFLVHPGDGDKSYLMQKLSGSGPCFGGAQMPKGAPTPLISADVKLILGWINGGAPNN